MKYSKKRGWVIILSIISILYISRPHFLHKTRDFSFSSSKGAKGYEEWESKGKAWFYDNLDNIDRKKIQQAMDYAINRQFFIDSLMKGYAVPIATEIGQQVNGYDQDIQPRELNLSKAKELLTEVFGKTYDPEKSQNDSIHIQMSLISE